MGGGGGGGRWNLRERSMSRFAILRRDQDRRGSGIPEGGARSKVHGDESEGSWWCLSEVCGNVGFGDSGFAGG